MEANVREKLWVLRATGLSLGYGDSAVIEGVSLEVDLGEVWFLLGANGSGKTTFVRAILGLLAPRSGTLELNPALGDNERIGYVPQAPSACRTMPSTLEELVRLGLVGSRTARARARENIDWALETTATADLRFRDVSTLSCGALQRALVARALVRRPTLLVLDYPTRNLDPATEEEVLSLVDSLNRDYQLTVICVTCDPEVASRHATHVGLFADGRVHAGPIDRVLSESQLARSYRPGCTPPWSTTRTGSET
jgi:ABC-type Mn2+/Zn2+ transport system ATPase subunit